ncbi:VanZ family protein [Sediminibacillus albus]|uniref:VanZ like family protein n=1 Tax=Sediminibacillus albus TaxID=407036 RepID=A0A1G8YG94_9BACI|nr:VanZ family protein [Sediminibacillus albus]SDK01939.1 VanZ like family protein [Sediminibacillus albus]
MFSFVWEAFHFIEFAILYLLLAAALIANKRYHSLTDLAAMIATILYAFIDEIHQFYVPGRSFSQLDLVKDMAGIIVAWTVLGKFYLEKQEEKD